MLPLLDEPCRGNPLNSNVWPGSVHPVPRGQAQPTVASRYRYVLRVSIHGQTGDIRDGDLIVVETLEAAESAAAAECVGVVVNGDGFEVRKPRKSDLSGSKVWGWCVGIVWRRLPAPV